MTSALDLPPEHPFGAQHLPYGSMRRGDGMPFCALRIGDHALDLSSLLANTPHRHLFRAGNLNAFLAAGRPVWNEVRAAVGASLSDQRERERIRSLLVPVTDLVAALPFDVADFVDFYASEHHATNVGRIFRPDGAALTPNWKHLPIGYHGRAGTIVVSGSDVRRPSGQARDVNGDIRFGPSTRLDFEAEVAFVVGAGSTPGQPVPVSAFRDHVFGICLLNDWSARDIQAWEYVPLGPFLGKSFATSVSGWVTPLEALDGVWCQPPPRDPPVLPYLDDAASPAGLELNLQVRINDTVVSRPPFATMYWTGPQLLAHTTVNGAHLRTGDLLASGTVSGALASQRGSLLELAWGGREPITLEDGTTRAFLLDGDEVVLTASASTARGTIGLGEVRGRVRAALPAGAQEHDG